MSLNDEPFFPYPRNPVTRFGFIMGDLVATLGHSSDPDCQSR